MDSFHLEEKELLEREILHAEKEINHLWGELHTVNIAHGKREQMEQQLACCEERFKEALEGKFSCSELEEMLHGIDYEMSMAAVQQAENQISKLDKAKSDFQALERVKERLLLKQISPAQGRHDIKHIMRHR